VVSEEFRQKLEHSGFAGLQFKRAVKARVIRLPWHEWDRAADVPKKYPPSGEPEDYIWDKPHDARAAAQMLDAWEFLAPVVPLRMEQLEDPRGGYLDKYRAGLAKAEYPSLFVNRAEYGNLVVDDKGRDWFESRVGEWVRFCEVEPTYAGRGKQ
jgi:hypothetical protein